MSDDSKLKELLDTPTLSEFVTTFKYFDEVHGFKEPPTLLQLKMAELLDAEVKKINKKIDAVCRR